MSRFEIDFVGSATAEPFEFFPDGPDEPTNADVAKLLLVDGPSLTEFLLDWNYGEDLTVVVHDNEMGYRYALDGMTGDWGVVS